MSEFKSSLLNLPVALFQWARAQNKGTLTASLRGISELKFIDAINDVGSTNLLLWAAKNGDQASAPLALKKSVDTKVYGWLRQAPLSLAAENGHVGVVEVFLDTGRIAVNTADWRGRTSSAWATGYAHTSVVRLLSVARLFYW